MKVDEKAAEKEKRKRLDSADSSGKEKTRSCFIAEKRRITLLAQRGERVPGRKHDGPTR